MSALTRREGAIVAALADAVAAPEPPLPAVAQTDTVAAFETFLAHAPRANRFALRAVLHALDLAPRVTARSARVGVSPTESVKRAKRGGSRLRFISRSSVLPASPAPQMSTSRPLLTSSERGGRS